jgi:hypothetical protein
VSIVDRVKTITMISFNLNQTIFVNLTDLGYQRLADLHNRYVGRIPTWVLRTAEYYREKANAEGYTTFAAWDFMAKFGPVTEITSPQYYHLDILIDVKS